MTTTLLNNSSFYSEPQSEIYLEISLKIPRIVSQPLVACGRPGNGLLFFA